MEDEGEEGAERDVEVEKDEEGVDDLPAGN